MKRLTAALLAVGLASSSAAAFAQSTYYPPSNGYNDGYQQPESYTDYARVVRVDPVMSGGYGTNGGYGTTQSSYSRNGQRCYQSQTAGSGYPQNGEYGSYGNTGYPSNNGYNDQYGYPQAGTNTGRTVATVVGGIAGAVLGSKVGGGTGSYAATAIGSMVGGMAGRQVYERTQANRYVRPGVVTVCDPEPVRGGYSNNGSYDSYRTGNATAYDVTYEYNGRRYTRRMDYNPGARVRVRVDVSPQ